MIVAALEAGLAVAAAPAWCGGFRAVLPGEGKARIRFYRFLVWRAKGYILFVVIKVVRHLCGVGLGAPAGDSRSSQLMAGGGEVLD
ncbi:hypothetical protein [Actinomadura craniellae]|uniref:hypothetical protein n=1 Tax=Actinomadura craniellae TaxID=2231787 RepID=UPI0011BD94F6|nr:hypothetical protein [Actinomadura craniellae]